MYSPYSELGFRLVPDIIVQTGGSDYIAALFGLLGTIAGAGITSIVQSRISKAERATRDSSEKAQLIKDNINKSNYLSFKLSGISNQIKNIKKTIIDAEKECRKQGKHIDKIALVLTGLYGHKQGNLDVSVEDVGIVTEYCGSDLAGKILDISHKRLTIAMMCDDYNICQQKIRSISNHSSSIGISNKPYLAEVEHAAMLIESMKHSIKLIDAEITENYPLITDGLKKEFGDTKINSISY